MEATGITARWLALTATLPANVKLIAVSKGAPRSSIEELYRAGQRAFGENRVQELLDKCATLPADIEWHMIGHLQTNKVKHVAPFITLVHGIDSARLLEEIDREGVRNGRIIPCLLQFRVATEQTKFGMTLEQVRYILEHYHYPRVRLTGVMGMATRSQDTSQTLKEFTHLRSIFETLKRDYFPTDPGFKELSMGMSDDYSLAIQAGATFLRIGSAIFAPC